MYSRNIQLMIIIISCILTLVATDILLPSLPQIAQYFSISPNDAKMIISIFLIGQFATVLIWGVIADLLGRKKTLFIGMLIFLLAPFLV